MCEEWMIRAKTCLLLFAWFLPAVSVAQAAPSQEPHRTWITNVNIISPENLNRVERGSVLIEDEKIVRVERTNRAQKPAGAAVVSGNRQFLVPGLTDSHVHLTLIPGMSDDQAKRNPEIVDRYFKQVPRSYLYYGYTTGCGSGSSGQSPSFRGHEARPPASRLVRLWGRLGHRQRLSDGILAASNTFQAVSKFYL